MRPGVHIPVSVVRRIGTTVNILVNVVRRIGATAPINATGAGRAVWSHRLGLRRRTTTRTTAAPPG